MIATDEDALICDLAETYRVFDYESLPVELVATLSVGLGPNSRIKLKLQGLKQPWQDILLAGILDRLSLLVWMNTEDGRTGANRPKSVLECLLGESNEGEGFDSVEEYEEARALIMKGGE